MVEWSTLVKAGESNIRLDFTNGSISTRGVDPATFTTSNLGIQAAVEASDKFKKGRIKLVSKYEIGEAPNFPVLQDEKDVESTETNADDQNAEAGGENTETEGKASYLDVKNSQMAKDILMGEPYNIQIADMPNKTAILEKASELNVVFPNWK